MLGLLAIYIAVSSLVTDDAWLTRVGTHKELYVVLRDVREVDREADFADAPVTWIVGSSITRDAFDAEVIEQALREGGSEHRVAKFAFNRGAPIFSQAVLDELPVRPGDRVVTTIAEGNFRWGWLESIDGFDLYVETLLGPHEILPLSDVALPTRLEWSLASTPPAQFYANQGNFRRGIVRSYRYWLGLSSSEPTPRVSHRFQPFNARATALSAGKARRGGRMWRLPPDEVHLGPGQTNWEGLSWLIDDCEARGAELTVLYIPGHPSLYPRLVREETVEAMMDHFDGRSDVRFVRMRGRDGSAYYDHKHPNTAGRPLFSRDLADILLQDEGLQVPPRAAEPTLAEPGELPARLFDGVRP